MQKSRRQDPYPWTWELPLAVVVAVLLVMVIGIHLGRSVANVLAGGRLGWPSSSELFRSAVGVVGGDGAAGLNLVANAPVARGTSLWVCIGVVEVLLLTLVTGCLVAGLRRWGPGRMRGMASRSEAELLLGVRRLRRHRRIVRPDLYGKGRTPS